MEEQKQEITNAVLAEKISGLTKLTDERFLNLDKTLTRIESNSSGFATKGELEEAKKDFTNTIKQIRDGFDKHNADDKESFDELKKQGEDNKRIIYIAIGGITVISFLMQMAAPAILKFMHLG